MKNFENKDNYKPSDVNKVINGIRESGYRVLDDEINNFLLKESLERLAVDDLGGSLSLYSNL